MIQKKALIILFLSICTSILAVAQSLSNQEITFKIVDDQKQIVSYSDVYLLNHTDSSIVASSMPDENGVVVLEVVPNNYIIFIKTEGFQEIVRAVDARTAKVDLGTIELALQPMENVYNEVVVTTQKSIMELKIDKRIYNVDADINNQGGTAADVLENIPSVTVDPEGNVSLRGNGSVRILIDGKLSGFASTGDALKMLQADAIERVEVITNASSRYDAEGDAGVINIILKKEKNHGFNAIVNLRTGYFPDHGVGVRVNYKKNKVNIFADANVGYSEFPGNSSTTQTLTTADTQFSYHQDYLQERTKLRFNTRVGMDYDWNKNNTTSIELSLRDGDGVNTITRVYDNFDRDNVKFNTDTRIEDQIEDERLYETTLNHLYTFNDKGSWKTSLSYYNDRDNEHSDYTEHSTLTGLTKLEESSADVKENVIQFQSDVVFPISENGKFETGVRFQNRNFLNGYRYRFQVTPTEWSAPDQYNNDVEYDDKVYAAYLMGSNTFGDWGVQGGLRAEYSEIYTVMKSDNEKKPFDFLNLFPSAAVSYKVNEYNNLQWSLSRRIRRPGQWDLLPFRKFGDNREMMIGNPNLKPELTYSTEVTWMKYLNNGSILSSVYYRHTSDKIERIATFGADGVIYRQPMNIASSASVGAEFILNYQFTKWLRFNTNFNLFNQSIKGEYLDQDFDKSTFSWTNRTSLNIVLPYDIKSQISFQYEAPKVNPQGRVLHTKWMDVAISKDIMKQKATIGFNVRDLFDSRIFRQEVETPELNALTHFQWRQRSFMLTFTYRFNHQMKDNDKRDGSMMFDDGMMD